MRGKWWGKPTLRLEERSAQWPNRPYFSPWVVKVVYEKARRVSGWKRVAVYFSRKMMRPLERSYGVISTFTLSPVRMRM